MKKRFLLSFLLISSLSSAQVDSRNPFTPKVFSNSPNSSSLGQYNPYEIDLFSGQPNINFNFFTYHKDGYNLDLNLSYNLSSIKPDIPPTWTGVGWNLNVGGVITRTIKGGVDEVLVSNYTPNNKFSYYDNYNKLAAADWNSTSKLVQFMNDNVSIGNGNPGVYPSPDEFNFSVNGMTGSFYKNHEGKWVISSGDFTDIKIEDELIANFRLKEDGLKSVNNKTYVIKRIIYGFTLTDTKGIKYIFGKTPESIEFSATPYGSPDIEYRSDFVANSWFLTKVITPNNFQITYNYERENKAFFKVNASFSAMYTKIGNVMERHQRAAHLAERTFVTYLKNININDLYSIDFFKSTANVEEYDYTKVNGDPWTSVFGYTHHYKIDIQSAKHFYKLDKIVINKGASSEEINFSYLENPTKKLFLTSFTQNDKKHTLEYFSTDLPQYNQFKNDHWGYFNNKSFSGISPEDGMYLSADQLKNDLPLIKETDPSQLTKGVLKKIIFPTKGFSEFFYEPHDYSKIISANTSNPVDFYLEHTTKKIAGGLRIQKTITDPGDTQKIIKEYFYTDNGGINGNSTGILSGKPIYYEEDQNSNSRVFRFADMPIIPVNTTKGKHITYSKVTERVSGTNEGGSTEYIFSNSDNGFIDKRPDNFIFQAFSINNSSIYNNLRKLNYNNLEFERGKPLSVTLKNKSNQIVQQTNYTYRNEVSRFDNRIRAYDFQSNVYGRPIADGPYTVLSGMADIKRISAYKIYSYHPYLSKKEEIIYDQNGNSIINTEEYKYNNGTNHLLKELKTVNSKNESIITEYQYPCDLSESYLTELCFQNRIAEPVITKQKVGDVYISEVHNQYNLFQNIIQKSATHQKRGTGINTDVSTDRKITYDFYDNKGNILQYTLENGLPVSVIWGYGEQYPIAKIEGTAYNQISIDFIKELQDLSNEDNDRCFGLNTDCKESSLRKRLDEFRSNALFNNSMVTMYTYDPLIGVTSIIQPNGQIEYYNYDAANRLQSIVNDQNEVIKTFEYNFSVKPTYYNTEIKQIVYKECNSNEFSNPITYVIPANKYSSRISITDANNIAIEQEKNNAQNFANNEGSCSLYNCQFEKTKDFTFAFTSLSKFDLNTVRLQFAIYVSVADVTNSKNNWNEGVYIGYVTGNCIPSKREYFTSKMSGSNVEVGGYIEPTGAVYITLKNYIANNYIQADIKYNRK
ncbi:DUF5977 domain-containing protein [Empedobacter brevis]